MKETCVEELTGHRILKRFGMEGVLKIIQFYPSAMGRDALTTWGCSGTCPAWPGTFPGMVQPQLLWVICASPPSQGTISFTIPSNPAFCQCPCATAPCPVSICPHKKSLSITQVNTGSMLGLPCLHIHFSGIFIPLCSFFQIRSCSGDECVCVYA